MNKVKSIAVAALAGSALVAAASVPASAADLYTPPAQTEPTPMAYDDPGFDWNRFYVGVYGATQHQTGDWDLGAGVDAGINRQFDYFLLGGEVALTGLYDDDADETGLYGQVIGKAGAVVTDDLVAYAAAGFGGDMSDTSLSDGNWLVGGGLEYAVTDDVSIKGQYLYGIPTDSGGSTQVNQITIGANWHF